MSIRHSVIGLVEILQWMQERGFNKDKVLQNTHIDDARLADPKATLLPREELQFYRNLLTLSRDPNILLEAGFNLKLATYGIWGLALISSPTFEKAIELGIQFIDFTYTYNQIVFFEEGQEAGLRIYESENLADLQKPMIERDISASFVLFQVLLQTDNPVDVIHFPWPKDKPLTYYEDLFGCEVRFEQAHAELRFAHEKLGTELPQHNELAMQLCKTQLEEIRPQLSVQDSVFDRVHQYLSVTPLYRCDMEECAQQLGISSRTLRRQLTSEGYSFQGILDDFRYLLAQRYLNSTSMTLEDIAERLGYSDAANFSHAFKRWSGKAPRSTT